jgi:AcrR family transcriptional regulator
VGRPASDIAERLVKAARAHFLECGVEGASLRAIARNAGTSLGMVTYYFPTKEALFTAVVEPVYASLVADLRRAIEAAPSTSVAGRIEALYARLATLSHEEQAVVRIVVREALGPSPRIAELFARLMRGHAALIAALVSEGAASGEVRTDLPPLVLVAITSMLGVMPQLIRLRLLADAPAMATLLPPADELAAALARFVSAGMKAASPHAPERARAAPRVTPRR